MARNNDFYLSASVDAAAIAPRCRIMQSFHIPIPSHLISFLYYHQALHYMVKQPTGEVLKGAGNVQSLPRFPPRQAVGATVAELDASPSKGSIDDCSNKKRMPSKSISQLI
jgi:hypothetical protein